jgi:5-oxopent-3-ene-1,2,5-tricarboxylate decarboxylase/2-hydroxyhepta-2,4-diene-1,7-dioate isomerase
VTGTVYGAVLNDQASMNLLGDALLEAPYKGKPKAPALYIKPENTLVGHGGSVTLPARATELEIGATLGLVIGRSASRVTVADALDHVRGYTIVIDLSIPHASVYRPAIREKCFDGACPMGPVVVERGDLGDPHGLAIRTYVNDKLVAERKLDDLVRPIPQLIADVSEFMTLLPDQVLLPSVPLGSPTAQAGDRVAVEIDGIGRLEITLAGGAA